VNVIIVLLYAPERAAATCRIAKDLHRALGGKIVVVINGRRVNHVPLNAEVIEHDNSGMEFGGYQAGLDTVGDVDRAVIVNDTICHHDTPTSTLLRSFVRQTTRDLHKFALGRVYTNTRTMRLQGLESSRWIRTHLFALDGAALRALGNRIYCPELDSLITASPHPDLFFGGVTGEMRDLLSRFLFTPGPYSWYAATPLRADNCAAMARKAGAILQEKYLTMRLEAADAGLWDISMSRKDRVIHRAQSYLWQALHR